MILLVPLLVVLLVVRLTSRILLFKYAGLAKVLQVGRRGGLNIHRRSRPHYLISMEEGQDVEEDIFIAVEEGEKGRNCRVIVTG